MLASKLTPPRLPKAIRRPRLCAMLQRIKNTRLALVVAGAGFGKTTAVAHAMETLDAGIVWYTLDESDRDLCVFLSVLLTGLRALDRELPFGQPQLSSHVLQTAAGRAEVVTSLLSAIEEQVQSDLVLVLDDFHLVRDCDEIVEALQVMVSEAPRNLHFLVASRSDAQLSSLKRAARHDVIEVWEAELSFTHEETAELLSCRLERRVEDEEVRSVLRRTGGWAAALVLTTHAGGRKPADPRLDAPASEADVFAYFEQIVFIDLSPEMRWFVLRASLLSTLEPALCNEALSMHDADVKLMQLCSDHLFVVSSGTSYRFHHLFRAFLRDRLAREAGGEAVRALHCRIGDALIRRGRPSEATAHYLEGAHYTQVATVLKAMTAYELARSPLALLIRGFEALPLEQVRDDAALTYLGAWIASFRGNMAAATEGFVQALERFEEEGKTPEAMRCRKDLGLHRYLTGDAAAAREATQALWGEPAPDPFFAFEVAGRLILFNALLGDFGPADEVYKQMLALLSDAPESAFARDWLELCRSMRLFLSGRFDHAFVLSTKVVEAFRSRGMELMLPLATFQVGLFAFYDGHREVGARVVEDGLRLVRRMGIRDHQYAWLLYARALNSVADPNHGRFGSDARQALELFSGQGNTWGTASVYELLAHECQLAGQLTRAEQHLRAGLRVLEPHPLPVSDGALSVRLCEVLIGLGRHEEALRIAEEHASTIALSTFHQYRVNLVRARFAEAGGDRQGAALSCRAAVTLARDHGYDLWLSEEAAKSPELFALLRADPTLGDYLAKIAPRAVSVPLAEPLRVKCLGSFSLAVGDRLVDDSAWRSSKALRIFQVLLIKGARGFVPIELLLEFAWPETAPDVGRRRFHVAMTSLRKVLEPGLQRGTPSCYIIRRHDAYRVAVGPGGDVDFLAFDRAVRAAKQAIGSGNPEAALEPLLRAVELYRGPLLAEFPFEDAIRSERTALEQAFRSALGDLLRLYERKQAWERCAGVAERYLDHDPLAEPMYRRLMRYHASRGDRAAVTLVFERCRENLARELGVGLSDDTLRLRRTLFES